MYVEQEGAFLSGKHNEWETVWEVFPEFLDNHREPATIPLTNPSTIHTSTSSTTHCSTYLVTLTTISHADPQTISYTNITISNNTPKLAQTTLSTTPTTISITTTSFFEPATFPKQPPSKTNSFKKSARVTIPKGRPPLFDIFPSRDFRLKQHKKYSLPFRKFHTSLITAPTSDSKSSTSISITTVTKLSPKSRISPPTSPKPTPKHFTSITDKHHFSAKDIAPTATTNTSPTKIPALMSINTNLPPKFCMSHPHTSSITIPLSPSIPPCPSFPGRCRNSNNRDAGERPDYTNNSLKKSRSPGDSDTSTTNTTTTTNTRQTPPQRRIQCQ